MITTKTNQSPRSRECPCKNCGKRFAGGGKGRPKTFCCGQCRKTWGNAHYYRTKRLGRNPKPSKVYLVPVFRKEPDIERLGRAIIAQALATTIKNKKEPE